MLSHKKKVAARILKCSPKRVVFDEGRLDDIDEAITRKDIRFLISNDVIRKQQAIGISRFRARKTASQKRKGRQKGSGSRKGRQNARQNNKLTWIIAVRAQRDYAKALREENKIEVNVYKEVYNKIKGGFFRSRGHIKLYLTERGLMKK